MHSERRATAFVGEQVSSFNRRSSSRHAIQLAAHLVVGDDKHEATIVDLSLGGAQLNYDKRLRTGQKVKVLFQVPVLEHNVDVDAVVRWSNGQATGVQFEGLRARDVWALNKFFETLE